MTTKTTKCCCIPCYLPQEIDSHLEYTVLSPLLIRNPQLIARDTVAVERTARRKEGKLKSRKTEDGSGSHHVCTSLSKNAHTTTTKRERIDISRLRGRRCRYRKAGFIRGCGC